MRYSVKGESSAPISVIIGIVIVSVVAILLFFLLNSGGSSFNDYLTECTGYCAPSCTAVNDQGDKAGMRTVKGDDYCAVGVYDISKGEGEYANNDDSTFGTIKNWFSGTVNEQDLDGNPYVTGKELGLVCCTERIGSNGVPASFLTNKERVGEISQKELNQITYIRQPEVRMYLQDRTTPTRNGNSLDIISGQQVKMRFDVDNIMGVPGELHTVKKNDEGKWETDKKIYCQAKILLDNKIVLDKEFNDATICNNLEKRTIAGTQSEIDFKTDVEFTMPAQYEGKALILQLSFTKDNEGKYVGTAGDTLYSVTLNVRNPIRVLGITGKYAQEQNMAVNCQGVTCTTFRFALVEDNTTCTNEYFTKASTTDKKYELLGPENSASKKIDKTTFAAFNIPVNKEAFVCLYAREKSGIEYIQLYESPIKLDLQVDNKLVTFINFPNPHTEVYCKDTQSGCTASVGVHFVSDPLQFVQGLMSGGNNDAACPQERSAYSFTRSVSSEDVAFDTFTSIPYISTDTVNVLCVRIEDTAGNQITRMVMNYNVLDAVEVLLNEMFGNK